jgi:hypothetical protein
VMVNLHVIRVHFAAKLQLNAVYNLHNSLEGLFSRFSCLIAL